MTLDQLIAFNAIVKAGSFRGAALAIRISQPAISIAIKKLEEELSLTLFARDRYRATLTPSGKAFYEKTQIFLNDGEALKKFGKTLGSGVEPEIRIAVEVTNPLPTILEHLKTFFDNHPHTQLILQINNVGGSLALLLEGKVDFAFTPELPKNSEKLRHIDSIKTGLVEMIPVHHRTLFAKNKTLTEADLQQKNQIIVSAGESQATTKSYGILPEGKKWIVSDFMVKKAIIMAGLGWGGLPDYMIQEELKKKSLLPVGKQIQTATFKTYGLRKNDTHHGPVATKLWEYLKKSF